jgi:hypothetical protein
LSPRTALAALATLVACGGAPVLISAPMVDSSAPAAHDVGEAAKGIDGDWEGRGTQSDDRSWPMRVRLASMDHGLTAQVFYPDEGCIGDWAMHEVEHGLWEGDETIRSDPRHRCIPSGSVTLRQLDDGTLEWTWEGIDPTTGADLSARAVLSRGGAQPETVPGR